VTEGIRSIQGPITWYAFSLDACGEKEARRGGGNEPLPGSLTVMKFLKFCESDHLVIPLAIDLGLAISGAALATAMLRYIFEMPA
jgi:hypothetical protein